MKVLQFTIPVAHDKSVIIEQVDLPHFYPYLHRHHEMQLTWIQEGEGTLIAGNSMHAFAPGDIFLLGSNLPHLFKSHPEYFTGEPGMAVKAVTVFFDPNGMLASMFEMPEMKAFKTFFQQHQQGFKVPPELVEEIIAHMLAAKKAFGPDVLMHFLGLIRSLHSIKKVQALSAYVAPNTISEHEGIRISNIYNYIMQHYSRSVTLEEVANAAYMTPQAFCRYFKKHTGHTFVSFLNEVRINEACKKFTDYQFENISSVAYQCGFNSITNFNRVFRGVIGSSPREYLDKYANSTRNLTKAS